jgi:hypothetical protein
MHRMQALRSNDADGLMAGREEIELLDSSSSSSSSDSSGSDTEDLSGAEDEEKRCGTALRGEQGWCSTDADPAVQARWLWRSGHRGSASEWATYPAAEGRQVESAFRIFISSAGGSASAVHLTIGARAYIIDYETMTQAPATAPQRTRKIRREERRVPRALVSLDVMHAVPRAIPAAAAEFGATDASLRSRAVRVAPPCADNHELHSAHALAGCVAVVQCGGAASCVDTARLLQSAGAVAVVFVSADDELASLRALEGESHGDVSIPCVCVSRSGGELVADAPAPGAAAEVASGSGLSEAMVVLRLRPARLAGASSSAAAATFPSPVPAAVAGPASASSGSLASDTADARAVAAGAAAELNQNRHEVHLVDTSSDDDDTQADIYGPSAETESASTAAAAVRTENSGISPSATSQSPGDAAAHGGLDETLLLDSSSESDDTGEGLTASRDIGSEEEDHELPAAAAAVPAAVAAAAASSGTTSAAIGTSSSKSKRGPTRTAAGRADGKTRRTAQLRASLEHSLHARGDGAALVGQLQQDKGLQSGAWEVTAVSVPVPYAVLFTHVTRAVPYRRAADEGSTGTIVAEDLLPRAAVVLPMAALFALVDVGGLAAVAGHLQAVRSFWRQQQQQQAVATWDGGREAAVATADCIVHYILEALPRSEKERAAVLRQHAPRPPAAGVAGLGAGDEGTRRGAAAAARQRAATLEMALLWLGVESAGVIVHHTETPSASVDYLSRLVGKLGASAATSSDGGVGADGNGSTARAREQFEAHAAWKPDYAALKLLAPQHTAQAQHGGGPPPQQQPTGLHPMMKAYFAVLCAVRGAHRRPRSTVSRAVSVPCAFAY